MSDMVKRLVKVSHVFHDGTSMHVLNAGKTENVPRGFLKSLEDQGIIDKASSAKAASGSTKPEPVAKVASSPSSTGTDSAPTE